jgi:DhnA family fructose-bisphosphate aldolase class Ia
MFCSSYYGKKKRLYRFIKNGRTLIVPVDDSLIFGPFNGLNSLDSTLNTILKMEPNAILGYKAGYSILEDSQVPFILNITASTTMGNHVKKFQTSSVMDALIMGAECIAVHVNYTSEDENDMLKNMSQIISEADKYGMGVLAIAYPRKSINGKDYNYEDLKEKENEKYTDLICHCVRASVELGADIVKTQYTGNKESFNRVIKSSMGKPVVIAGGPLVDVYDSYKMARDALDVGAAGISFGRNVFNAQNIEMYLAGMKEIIFNNVDVDKAFAIYNKGVHNV